MASAKSFSEYLQTNFYSTFYEAIENYLYENPEDALQKVEEADDFELDDLAIKKTYLYRVSETVVKVDCVFEAELSVSQFVHKYSESIDVSEWFLVSCIGDLRKDFKDLVIEKVEKYNGRSQDTNYLSDSLVPYLKEKKFDVVATDILKKFYPESIGKDQCKVIPEILAQRMGLSVIERRMSNDNSIFGQIFFADTEVLFFDEQGHEYRECVSAKTIVYDSQAHYMHSYGNNSFTIAHECVHWYLHRCAYELERMYNEDASRIQCETSGVIKEGGFKSATDWMEWQANGIAACLLMPKDQFRVSVHRLKDFFISLRRPKHSVDITPEVIDDLSNYYGTSRQATRIRLIDLGFYDAVGAYDWFDGAYLRPYAFSSCEFDGDMTYVISFEDFARESIINPSIGEAVGQGRYVYVESMVCLNDPDYVEMTEKGLRLTDYARYHINDCCLAFKISVRRGSRYGKQLISRCSLFRAFETLNYDIHLLSDKNVSVEKKAKELKKYLGLKNKGGDALVHDLLTHFPDDFSEAIDKLVKIQETTIYDLELETGLANKTINDMKHGRRRTVQNGVAICIGLHISPELSFKLLDTLGIRLRNGNDDDLAYKIILASMYLHDIGEINMMLIKMGRTPLTGKCV